MIASHAPEVLRALAERLRREHHAGVRPWLQAAAGVEISSEVHELERLDIELAIGHGVLELDRAVTAVLAAGGGAP